SQVDRRGARALIVDDNATSRESLRLQLAAWDMGSEEVGDGAAALELLGAATAGEEPFDLAILDLQMPGMDGLELARAIRADRALTSLPLVADAGGVQRPCRGDARIRHRRLP